jgi:uncharacterized membrane protein YfcA
MNVTIYNFIIFNIILISIAFWSAYQVRKYVTKKNDQKQQGFIYWFNQGTITPKGVFVSLVFGIVFGFLDNFFMWMGLDKMMKFIPGGILTKGAWGNTYSDFVGATIGASVASIANDLLHNDDSPPIWANALGITIGCIFGMYVGGIVTGKK